MATTYSAVGKRFDWHLRCIKSKLGEYKMLLHSENLTDEQADEQAEKIKQYLTDLAIQKSELSDKHH